MTGEVVPYGSVTLYERFISLPAARAGMTETDWIANRAIDAAYEEASRRAAHDHTEAAA